MGLLRPRRTSWLDNSTNAWTTQNLNSLQYNTSQPGAVIPIIYGTARQQCNLIALGTFTGPTGGKKGGTGTLPLTGTNTTRLGKGGGGAKSGSKKGGGNYSIDVDFGFCQGPVGNGGGTNLVFANAAVGTFSGVGGINFYAGNDGQAADPVFAGLGDTVGYSGTCHVTGTPLDLGMAPALPNISLEITGFFAGVNSNGSPDANPGDIVLDYLSNDRYGAGFPAANIDDLDPTTTDSYGAYCLAANLLMSPVLTSQQQAHQHLDGITKLTNSAIVWSGDLLKIIPYGDQAITANGVTWTPNLIPEYSLTDDDFLPWSDAQLGKIQDGQDDPILGTRSNPADAVNWMTIEYKDRINYYDPTVLPDYDQGAIDLYGTRSGEAVQGHAFTVKECAKTALRLILQRGLYDRNTFKFKLGWKFSLLELMDIVLLTGRAGDLYLDELAVRITRIAEDEDGGFTIEAEEIVTGTPVPPVIPPPYSPLALGASFSYRPGASSPVGPASSIVTPNMTLVLPFVSNGQIYTSVDIAVMMVAWWNDGSSPPPAIDTLNDSFGLAWQLRSTFAATMLGGGQQVAMRIYWADASAMVNGDQMAVTIGFAGAVDIPLVLGTFVAGGVDTAFPWDSNVSLPKHAIANLSNPILTGISTSSVSRTMLLDWIISPQDIEGLYAYLGGLPTAPWGPGSWGFTRNALTSKWLFGQTNYAAVSGPVTNTDTGGYAPIGNSYPSVNENNLYYLMVADAIKGV